MRQIGALYSPVHQSDDVAKMCQGNAFRKAIKKRDRLCEIKSYQI